MCEKEKKDKIGKRCVVSSSSKVTQTQVAIFETNVLETIFLTKIGQKCFLGQSVMIWSDTVDVVVVVIVVVVVVVVVDVSLLQI